MALRDPAEWVAAESAAIARAERLAAVIVDFAVQLHGQGPLAAVAALSAVDGLTEAAHDREASHIAEVAAEAAASFN